MTITVDPVAFHFGPIAIHWYGVSLALAFLGGYLWLKKLEYFLYLSIGGLIGAKLLFLLISFLEQSPHSSLLFPLSEGFSFHGGLLGATSGLLLYQRTYPRINIAPLLDRTVLYLPLGILLVRIGNIINQELVGRATDRPWAVVFPLVDQLPRHPVQLYEALAALFIALLLWLVAERRPPPLVLTSLFVLCYSAGRFTTDFFRDDQTITLLQSTVALTPAQWTSVVLLLLSALAITRLIKPVTQRR